MAPKRRAAASSASSSPNKKVKQTTLSINGGIASPAEEEKSFQSEPVDETRAKEEYGIIQRDFYPPEMSNERCEMYNNGTIPRPIEVLEKTLKDTKSDRDKIKPGATVVHWFKRDLRQYDNRALRKASELARNHKANLVCMFIVSPEDYEAHLTSKARVDFDLRTIEVLKKDLAEKNIPLYVHTVEDRKDVTLHIISKCEEWGAKHLFCNIEYEVDELRREAKLIKRGLAKGIAVEALHDDVVVIPGALQSGSGNQYSVYSPWFRAWTKYLAEHPYLLKQSEAPEANPPSAKSTFGDIFSSTIPSAPPNKSLDKADRIRLASLWPAGEHEAHARLTRFLAEKHSKYKDARNFPSTNGTSSLSVHFSAGTLSARSAVRAVKDKKLDTSQGSWTSEIAWRDFYKHILAHWPYVCMSKPFKYEYSDLKWEYNNEHFRAWTEGRTGYPIVDAAMRQCKSVAYIHNRCRMIVASFLAKDLLLDWRLGERYFMEHLIDGDFASNNGGWGFSASTGVDPQPYFRIFNPLLQSEKFDPEGEYIKKWVPELKDVKGKAVHDPYGRGEGARVKKLGYPEVIVEHKGARERALERFKKVGKKKEEEA